MSQLTTSQPRNCLTVKADSLTGIIQLIELYNAITGAKAPVVAFFSLSLSLFFFFGRCLI